MEIAEISHWTPPEVLVKYWPGGTYGVDKEGYPVWIDVVGTVDLKGNNNYPCLVYLSVRLSVSNGRVD